MPLFLAEHSRLPETPRGADEHARCAGYGHSAFFAVDNRGWAHALMVSTSGPPSDTVASPLSPDRRDNFDATERLGGVSPRRLPTRSSASKRVSGCCPGNFSEESGFTRGRAEACSRGRAHEWPDGG